jgi:hypothetical protein
LLSEGVLHPLARFGAVFFSPLHFHDNDRYILVVSGTSRGASSPYTDDISMFGVKIVKNEAKRLHKINDVGFRADSKHLN